MTETDDFEWSRKGGVKKPLRQFRPGFIEIDGRYYSSPQYIVSGVLEVAVKLSAMIVGFSISKPTVQIIMRMTELIK